jgi:hypothetical protein
MNLPQLESLIWVGRTKSFRTAVRVGFKTT